VIDAENIRICENLSQHRIERPRRSEIPAERLFDHHLARRVPDAPETLDDGREQAGRNGEIIKRLPGAPQRRAQSLVDRRVAVIALHVLQGCTEPRESRLVDAPVFLQAGVDASAKGVAIERTGSHADDRHVEVPVLHQALKRGIDFFSGKIAGGAEQHQRICG
jgi:hypothetical protein